MYRDSDQVNISKITGVKLFSISKENMRKLCSIELKLAVSL